MALPVACERTVGTDVGPRNGARATTRCTSALCSAAQSARVAPPERPPTTVRLSRPSAIAVVAHREVGQLLPVDGVRLGVRVRDAVLGPAGDEHPVPGGGEAARERGELVRAAGVAVEQQDHAELGHGGADVEGLALRQDGRVGGVLGDEVRVARFGLLGGEGARADGDGRVRRQHGQSDDQRGDHRDDGDQDGDRPAEPARHSTAGPFRHPAIVCKDPASRAEESQWSAFDRRGNSRPSGVSLLTTIVRPTAQAT